MAPSPVDALLLACIHRVAHHHDSDRLIWLYDIALLRERMSTEEHEAFWRLAAERQVVTLCSHSIELADDWFGGEPHDLAAKWLAAIPDRSDEPSARFIDQSSHRALMLALDLQSLPWRSRIRRLWDLALPPAEFIHLSFPLAPRLALPWLYIYRGARGMRRLLRRVSDPR